MAEKVVHIHPKEQVRRENEQHKDMDTVQQRCDKIAAAARDTIGPVCQIIGNQLSTRDAGTDNEKQILGEKAMTDGIRAMELIASAKKLLQSVENDLLTRLHASWEFAKRDMRQVVKERRFPKAQFELELGFNRTKIDDYHSTVERNGLERTKAEKTNNGRTARAA